MDNSDLKSKLSTQRKWRETQPAQAQKTSSITRGEKQVIVVGLLIVLIVANTWFFLTRLPKNEIVLPAASFSSTPTLTSTIAPSQTPVLMLVCTPNLLVRYTPNGSVRGYLREGEQVVLALDLQGKSITRTQDNETWMLIAAPVEGWANSKYLCK